MNNPASKTGNGPVILVVDDDPRILNLYRRLLADYPGGLYAATGTEALEMIDGAADIDLALIDFDLPGASGIEVVEKMKRTFPRAEVVVVTAIYDVQAAVESIQAGAARFITKPFQAEDILNLAEKILKEHRLRKELAGIKLRLGKEGRSFMVVGKSKEMRRAMDLVESTSGLDVTVLILGETGTGKDLLARVIHENSPRAEGPFVITDCAVLREQLIASDLFGHQKGAFTGASELRKGKFERADGGTIFLNEIGTLPGEAQAKLLRVLEAGEIERVGGNCPIPVDVRIIAATNRNLESAVEEGSFRRDLFHRINVVTLYLPPLRDRLEDIPILSEHFLAQAAKKLGKKGLRIDEEVYRIFFSYPWPGNIRELENTIERAAITARGEKITSDNLPPLLLKGTEKGEEPGLKSRRLDENEADLIRRALKESEGNISRAAEILGIARGTLYSKMKKHGIK
ncbi:MAG: sigma-54 dependent transcriptional regulator [Candidatus Erginobacter occultus]|nr:sigma-54 dependent transcriptional regulator [Candidatus Erginobacter occultus]